MKNVVAHTIMATATLTSIASARVASGQSCASVAPCPTRSASCSRTISCSGLNSTSFNPNETVCVSGGDCTITRVTINQPNVLFRGTSLVTVRHSATAATTFAGTLTAEGASGTFTLPNGARGE